MSDVSACFSSCTSQEPPLSWSISPTPASPPGPCHALPRMITSIVKIALLHYVYTTTSHCLAYSTTISTTLNPSQQSPLPPSFNSTQWPLPSTTSPTWQTTTCLLARDHHQPALCLLFLPNKLTTGLSLHVCPFDLQSALAPSVGVPSHLIRLSFHFTFTIHSTRLHNAIHWRAAVIRSDVRHLHHSLVRYGSAPRL
ncbi:uncharacterized protein M421DRAFT_106004 [Didymella exigua CBS 183.55]|uniref:Uncharacterized protein n=1 Tax=Didymella exigua CBS 183.55 TaxID=1150837 RepID=A0A6A5RZD3_9PLEO|nr:uncharacterized protein M421DRAFT_106004 [Didymella exigua CBS 183.55]KAF1933825.1 hypothetical protein M421DRAFT_106004 [Didymella exigua CBS 183.55]